MVLMDVVTWVLQSVVTAISAALWEPLKRHINYAFQLDVKITLFSLAIMRLRREKGLLQESIGIAQQRGETVYEWVLEWQREVESTITFGESLICQGEVECTKSCWCRNYITRYQIVKKLVVEEQRIRSLIADKDKFAANVSRKVEGAEARTRTCSSLDILSVPVTSLNQNPPSSAEDVWYDADMIILEEDDAVDEV